jgi:aryl-alcohol dehydrogenase-like predicted oxidoreductase
MHDRRRFLKGTLAGAGLLTLSPRSLWASPARLAEKAARSAADRVALGRTGIRCSFLAQGTGTSGTGGSSDHTRLGQAGFTRLLRHSLDQGINFVDMADQYGSHPFVREALKGVPRDQVVLLTKYRPHGAPAAGQTRAAFDRFREELGTEMVDVCLIHCVTDAGWTDDLARVRDELSGLKD